MQNSQSNLSYPFSIIANKGLGNTNSDTYQVGTSIPSMALGQAGVSIMANVTTGNLFIKDHELRFAELGGDIQLGYCYNSQALQQQEWKLAVGARVSMSTDRSTLLVTESDGHVVTYQFSEISSMYEPNEALDSLNPISINPKESGWIRFNRATSEKEYYDEHGLLVKKLDRSGNETNYKYDTNFELATITAASGINYVIKHISNQKEIWVVKDAVETLIQTYQFNDERQLINSINADGYTTIYQYNQSKQLESIKQTDGTSQHYKYKDNHLSFIQTGEDEVSTHCFDYAAQITTFRDACQIEMMFQFNSAFHLMQVIEDVNVLSEGVQKDAYGYEYNAAGQIKQLTYPDKTCERWDYDASTGLIKEYVARNGLKIVYNYNDSITPLLLSQSFIPLSGQAKILRFVYDELGRKRFSVSSEGRVKEYVVNEFGLSTSIIGYPKNTFKSKDDINLKEMLDWKRSLNIKRGNTTETILHYTEQGRVKLAQDVVISRNGDTSVPVNKFTYDIYGGIKSHLLKLSDDTYQRTRTVSNANGLPLSEIVTSNTLPTVSESNAKVKILQETVYTYGNNTITTVLPNKQLQVKTFSADGQLVSHEKKAHEINRRLQFDRAVNGEVKCITTPDGKRAITLYDAAHRLKYAINPSGSMTEYQYYSADRYQIKIQYANKISKEEFDSVANGSTDVSTLLEERVSDQKNRLEYTFYHVNGKPQFEVDAEKYLIENVYDDFGRIVNRIAYKDRISDVELGGLIATNRLERVFSAKDRVNTYYYDLDDNKIAEIDPANYVTRYQYNGTSNIESKIQYATPCTGRSMSVDELIESLSESEKFESFYFYDELSQLRLEVDPENYATSYDYYVDGKQKSNRRYAKALPANWCSFVDVTSAETESIVNDDGNVDGLFKLNVCKSISDQVTTFEYDDLRRLRRTVKPYNRVEVYTYDVSGNVLTTQVSEAGNASIESDVFRNTENRYDLFNQMIKHANPYVAKDLIARRAEVAKDAGIVSDILLSSDTLPRPESEIQAANSENENSSVNALIGSKDPAQIDESNLENAVYDASGLKIKTTNALGFSTLYYYDYNRQLAVIVNPIGAIKQYTRNAFGEIEIEKYYANAFKRDDLTSLTGGFIDKRLEDLLVILSDASHDSITQYERDNRGQITCVVDAEKHIKNYKFNAFKQCDYEEKLNVQDVAILKINRDFDTRGNVIELKTTIDEKVSKIQAKYDNFFNKQTQLINELGGRTTYQQDKLGRQKETSILDEDGNALTVELLTYDAFHRLKTKTDANNETTQYSYDDAKREARTISPCGITTSNQKNVFNEVVLSVNGLGQQEKMTHEPDGQLASHTQAGEMTELKHDILGRETDVINPLGMRTHTDYDEADHTSKVTENADADAAFRRVTSFQVNALGLREQVTNPSGVVTVNTFDRLGDISTSVFDPIMTPSLKPLEKINLGLDLLTVVNDLESVNNVELATRVSAALPSAAIRLSRSLSVNSLVDINHLPVGGHDDEVSNSNLNKCASDSSTSADDFIFLCNRDSPVSHSGSMTSSLSIGDFAELDRNSAVVSIDSLSGNLQELLSVNAHPVALTEINLVDKFLDDGFTLTSLFREPEAPVVLENPKHLNRLTSYQRDVDGQVFIETRGSPDNENQYCERIERDGLGRVKAKIVDPDGLAIKTSTDYDAIGNTICVTDANNRRQLKFYNSLNQLRFIVSEIDEVLAEKNNCWAIKEVKYTKTGKISSTHAYVTTLDHDALHIKTTFTEMKSFIIPSKHDTKEFLYYDKDNRPQFSVKYIYDPIHKKYQSIIVQDTYDAANKLISSRRYACLDVLGPAIDPQTLTASDLEAIIKASKRESTKDKITHYYHDDTGREIFNIDQTGRVIEKRYNACGLLVAEIAYGRPARGVPTFFPLHGKDIAALLAPYNVESRAHYNVYDDLGRVIFVVKKSGSVIRNDYDKNGLVTYTCQFEDTLTAFDTYAELVTKLHTLKPNPKRDIVRETIYDAEGAVSVSIDPLGYKDIYYRNDLGAVEVHVDRNNMHWRNHYDRAKRLEVEESPETTISVVKTDDNGKLVREDIRTTVKERSIFDGVGNTKVIVKAEGINALTNQFESERRLRLDYNAINLLAGKTVENVEVSIEDADGIPIEPTKNSNIVTKTIYNTLGKKIAELNANGKWDYYIHDSAGRLVYEIKKQSAVVRYTYNAFDQVVEEYCFANEIDKNLSCFENSNQMDAILDELAEIKLSEDDRVTTYEYDACGKVFSKKLRAVIGCRDDESIYNAQPETTHQYNVFTECVRIRKLIEPGKPADKEFYIPAMPGKWSDKFTWYDKSGRPCYTLNENRYFTFNRYNHSGKLIEKIEFANIYAGDQALDFTSIPVEEVEMLITRNPQKDRRSEYIYDVAGNKIEERLWNVKASDLERGDSKSTLKETQYAFIKKEFEYSPTQKVVKTTYEDGSYERQYYDERDIKIAETGVIRTGKNSLVRVRNLLPLTYFYPNAFRDIVATQTSADGGVYGANLPTFFDSKTVTQTFKRFDNRGLPTLLQDAKGNQVRLYFTATRKLAIQSLFLTTFVKNVDGITTQLNQIKKLFSYNDFDKTECIRDLYNGKLLNNPTLNLYNIFGDVVGATDDLGVLKLINRYDTTGQTWFSNAEGGANTLYLRNLLGFEVLKIQSPDVDLSCIHQDNINLLFNCDRSIVEFTSVKLDPVGRQLEKRLPIWHRDKSMHPTHTWILDCWSNVIVEIDSEGNVTDNEFDNRSLLIRQIGPEVDAVDDANIKIRIRPITRHYYNLRKGMVSTIDPNNHQELYGLNEANYLLFKILGDGVLFEYRRLNAFDMPVMIFDSLNNATQYEYDDNRNPKVTILAAENIDLTLRHREIYTHDEMNNRNSITTPVDSVYRFNHDGNNNCIIRMLPMLQVVEMTYDRTNQFLSLIVPDQKQLSWLRDFFGVVKEHRDLSLRLVKYESNFKNQVKTQTGEGGIDRWHEQYEPALYDSISGRIIRLASFTSCFEAPKQHLTFEYRFGLLTTTFDIASNRKLVNKYSNEQLLTDIEFSDLEGNVFRTINTLYDALRREICTTNVYSLAYGVMATAVIKILYDAASNLRNRNVVNVQPLMVGRISASRTEVDSWNTFDAADHILIVGGYRADDGSISIKANVGLRYTYSANWRKNEERIDQSGVSIKCDLNPDQESRLVSTSATNGYRNTFYYHKGGWVETNREDYSNGRQIKNNLFCDANGWTLITNVQDSLNGAELPGLLCSQTDYTNLMNGLNVNLKTTTNIYQSPQIIDYVDTFYLGGDVLVPWSVDGTRTYLHLRHPQKINSYETFDPNYNSVRKTNSEDDFWPTIYIEMTPNNWVLSKQRVKFDSQNPSWNMSFVGYYLLLNAKGVVHGNYLTNYIHDEVKPLLRLYDFNRSFGRVNPMNNDGSQQNDSFLNDTINQSISTKLDIHIVNPGDTFESIAEEVCGDVEYAYFIEKRNAYLTNKRLVPGTILHLPQYIPNKNKAYMARPYLQFVSLLTGSISPILPTDIKIKHKSNHWWVLGETIAMGLVMLFAPELAPAIVAAIAGAGTLTGISLTIAEAVTVGVIDALGDAAIQGVAIWTGEQQKFSYTEMLETGVSGSLGRLTSLFDQATLDGMIKEALCVGSLNAATQLSEMSLGLRSHFDGNALALQISSVFAASQIQRFSNAFIGDGFIARATTNTLTTASNSLLGKGITNTPIDIKTVATQAIGGEVSGEIYHLADVELLHPVHTLYDDLSPEALASMPISSPTLPLAESGYQTDPYTQGMSEINRRGMSESSNRRLQQWQAESAKTKSWADRGSINADSIVVAQRSDVGVQGHASRSAKNSRSEAANMAIEAAEGVVIAGVGIASLVLLPAIATAVGVSTTVAEVLGASIEVGSTALEMLNATDVPVGVRGGSKSARAHEGLFEKSEARISQVDKSSLSEIVNVAEHPEIAARNALNEIKLLQEKISATSINASKALISKYEAVTSAQKKSVKVEVQNDGSVKYYDEEFLSKTPGPTRGASYVVEYNPKTGDVLSWMESYDHSGNINRVHPKSYNGQILISSHYPPTLKDKLDYESYLSNRK